MSLKNCRECDVKPKGFYDELEIMYWLQCPKCGLKTQSLISPSSSLDNPVCDSETKKRLINEWNALNE